MAIPSGTIWEVRTTGNDLNGGGYNSARGGTDYSQQDSAQLSVTDLASVATSTTLTSATGGFTSQMVGNIVNISSGTGAVAGFYEITAYTDTNTVTIDRACTTAGGDMSSGAGKVGGALASIGVIGNVITTLNVVYIKSGTYVMTTSSTNVSNGLWAPSTTEDRSGTKLEGYENTRGDLSTNRPILQAQAALGTTLKMLFATSSSSKGWWHAVVKNIAFDGGNNTSITGLYGNNLIRAEKCEAYNCYIGFLGNKCLYCWAHDCNIGFMGTSDYCVATHCTSGFYNDYNATLGVGIYGQPITNCIASNCTTYGFGGPTSGTGTPGGSLYYINCTAIGCATGFRCVSATGTTGSPWNITVVNCMAYNCSSYGFWVDKGACFAGGSGQNTSGNSFTSVVFYNEFSSIDISPHTNYASKDYTFNVNLTNIRNKAKSLSSFFPSLILDIYSDDGAVQINDRYANSLQKIALG